MHIELNPPYEWEVVVDENGYTLTRIIDPKIRAKKLQEYKEQREKELLKELRELEMLQ